MRGSAAACARWWAAPSTLSRWGGVVATGAERSVWWTGASRERSTAGCVGNMADARSARPMAATRRRRRVACAGLTVAALGASARDARR
ncbi:hypothetical protein ON010_g10661 [Phytophthora cinnamomi]|nr:hypothetical protein ON010_g10661 [Phytophthora cinnamomi]